ncbi:xanthine dehydrogenase family protein molybdopterin-binding subunit [Magnetospira sp. QH-2]|uniref:xanthine dehydrogenase family protein molybdopterin-binding subunit n=1 Tax=Magnetospira sp. (strain QH-2) TaxID=1288970 RepID=UPI0003E81A0E|nr:molybdopterin cofactor-binding domain-containing protein [Magnetospira sp. QH-2]CCQ72160.1 Isoquinoline 1-oxidoreductase (molybdenum subunit) [Magnetospira sp. QH-2]
MTVEVSRRGFLQGAATGAAALVIGLNARGVLAAGTESMALNPFVRIDEQGVVTVILKHFEMGQGTTTGLTTLIAEELDADWATVRTEFAPADNDKYKNLFFGTQGTGGSTAMANSFKQYREAGATARQLLVSAAAETWDLDESEITISDGILSAGPHAGHFGQFIRVASTLTPFPEVTLKSPDQFKLIGNATLPRKDSRDKTDGTAVFAMDVKIPGMVYVAIRRSPKFGGVVTTFDATDAAQVPGFIDAKILANKAGVAVYARNTWAAFQARDALSAEWDFAKAERRSSDEMETTIRRQTGRPQFQVMKEFSTEQAAISVDGAAKTIEAEFYFPFLAHAPMEPVNCVVEPTETGGVRLHDGCQFPGGVQPAVAKVLNLIPEQVEIHTVYAGGSFGRRANPVSDYPVEAALAFDAMGRKVPVKLVWSREDDLHGGFYRPLAVHKARIGLNAQGALVGWDHRVAAKSILKGTPFEAFGVKDGIEHSMVEGIDDSLYGIPNMGVGVSDFITPIPALWWRSVGHTHTAYAMESLMDMIAHETGRDPVALRLSLLDKGDAKQARLAGVIEAVRDASGWQPGQKRGFAAHFSFGSYVAMVADVTVNGTEVHVDHLHMAVDCGVAVNPDVIKAQMEGGAGFGLGAILRNEITLDEGLVDQQNFPDYEPLRMADMPDISVTIIQSAEPPTGVGEPAVPPTGPAVANGIFALTGKRITDLPMTKAGFEFV